VQRTRDLFAQAKFLTCTLYSLCVISALSVSGMQIIKRLMAHYNKHEPPTIGK